jgi:AcrR family transcriptional regulator
VTQLRRDAARNRAALVTAGRDVFAEQGPDASLEEIARRADVGIGTLYRHFPTRDALVEVIFEEHFDQVVAAAETAAADEDGWHGIVSFMDTVLDLQSRNLPLRGVFLRLRTSPGIAERRKMMGPLLDRLVEHAREQGVVRDDFTVGDLSMAMWSFAPIFESTADVAPQAWRRHLQILLDGMRADAATPQTVRPLAPRQIERAMEALRERYHRRRAAA